MADSNLRRAYSIMLGMQPVTYTMYPLFTGATMTAGTVLTPGAGVWGALADIIAAAAIATEFWLVYTVFTLAAGAFALHEVRINNTTAAVNVMQIRVDPTAASPNTNPFPFPIPVHCNIGAQIQGQTIAANAADKISASILVATGL